MGLRRARWAGVVAWARQIANGCGPGDCTLRRLHYRLVAEGVIANPPPMYRRLSARCAEARRRGDFPDLVETLREVHAPPAWPDADAFLEERGDQFGLDRTQGQRCAPYLAAEKDTLRTLMTGWVGELGIPVLVVRGFGSQFHVDVVRARAASDVREYRLLVLGDCDASGEDSERDFLARTGCWSRTRRIALTYQQMRERGMLPAEAKKGDPRWPAFAHRHALDPISRSSGKPKPSPRPSCSAWSWMPSPPTSTAPSWPRCCARRRACGGRWPRAWRTDPCSVHRCPAPWEVARPGSVPER
ncbi:hypothetical protein [Streptomyces sp. NPDC003077]|uniref:hypothetical protein n=1 Tax=Streptomyces sp. NPDC003077 TaxID=3154443 RepID=UPI0033ADC73C